MTSVFITIVNSVDRKGVNLLNEANYLERSNMNPTYDFWLPHSLCYTSVALIHQPEKSASHRWKILSLFQHSRTSRHLTRLFDDNLNSYCHLKTVTFLTLSHLNQFRSSSNQLYYEIYSEYIQNYLHLQNPTILAQSTALSQTHWRSVY